MREIKFRVWDKAGKNWKNLSMCELGEIIMEPDRYSVELMQYTGLKDKQGKEIYEGDIIKCEQSILNVIWKVDGFEYIDNDGKSIMIGKHTPNHQLEFYEILGNIYENPNLTH